MLSHEEKEWLRVNEEKFSTAMKKFILFMYRNSNDRMMSIGHFAKVATEVENDMKEYWQDRVFGNQPDGKE